MGYRLEWKQGGGAYAAVPLVSSQKVHPVIEAADCTVSGSNTETGSWAVSHPAAATGDLLIFYIAWDDSVTTTAVTAPSGANGETLTAINSTPVTDASTETRAKAWYTVATGSWTATTKTFTPSASESWSATVIKVLAGEFDAATPIGASNTRAATGVADAAALSPAFTAGASDGTGTLVWCASVDADPLTGTITGWSVLQTQDLGAVTHGVAVRTSAVSDSESIAGGDTWTIASDSWTSVGFVVRAPTTNNTVYMSASANITAGGEATTFQLSAPSGKATSDFDAGRMWDDENGTDTVSITTDNYTELEWCIKFAATATGDYDFRVTDGGGVLNTYSVTPTITISSAVTLSAPTLTHSYTPKATQVRVTLKPNPVAHTYTGQLPKVNARVAPTARAHTYTSPAPAFVQGAMVSNTVSHAYSLKIPQTKSGVSVGQVTHTYTAQVPKVNAKVMPARVIHSYATGAVKVNPRIAAPFRTHVYSPRQPVISGSSNIPTVDHNYNVRPVSVRLKVRYGETFHAYTAVAPKANASVMPAARTHTYVAQDIQLGRTVLPPPFSHTYTVRTPQAKASIGPGRAIHSYVGRVASILVGNAIAIPSTSHVYTARDAQARPKIQAGTVTHAYSGRSPTTGNIARVTTALHSYAASPPDVIAGTILHPSQAMHFYTARTPQSGAQVVHLIPGHPLGRGRR